MAQDCFDHSAVPIPRTMGSGGSVGSPELSTGPTPARPQIPSYSRVVKVRKVRAREAHQEEAVQDLQRIHLSPVSEEVERETDDDEPDNEVLK